MPVAEAIKRKFHLTFELAFLSFIPVILGGVWIGKKTAVHHNTIFDHTTRVFVITGWSFPDFVFGLIVILVFYSMLGWFPPGLLSNWALQVVDSPSYNTYTNILTLDALLNGRLDIFWNAFRHLVGPVITASYLWVAFLIRITRSGMLEVLHKDYIRTARAKGLSERVVINTHASRNAMIPVLSVTGRLVVYALAETVIIETIFNRPGMGRFIAYAAQQLDYAGILGGTLFFAFLLVMGNLIVDVLYAVYDPRIQLK
jgi:peptide/nickel transport system permease protein